VASDQKKGKWALPTSLSAAGLLLLSGTGEITNAAQPGQKTPPTPKVAEDDTVKQKVQALISEIKTHLAYIGEVTRKTDKAEIEGHIKALGSEVYHEREKASKALIDIGYQAKPELMKALKNPDLEIARRAERVLETFRPIDAMRAKKLRYPVIQLGRYGALSKDAVPLLIEVLKEDNSDLKWQVATTLWYIGPASEPAVPSLIDFFKDRDPKVREHVAKTLGAIGPGAKAAVPALAGALKDKEPDVAKAAATTLGNIGPEAKTAVTALLETLKDSSNDIETRRSVAESLAKIGAEPKRVVAGLAEAFRGSEPNLKRSVISAIAKFGPNAKEAMPMLIEAIGDRDSSVARAAISTLAGMGEEAKAAVPALKAFRDSKPSEDEVIRWGKALTEQIRRQAGTAVEAIEKTKGR